MWFRYKREEVKIQAWENHEKRKAEMEMKKMEVRFSSNTLWIGLIGFGVGLDSIFK